MLSVILFDGLDRLVMVARRPGEVTMNRLPGREIDFCLPFRTTRTLNGHSPGAIALAGISNVEPDTSIGGTAYAVPILPKKSARISRDLIPHMLRMELSS